MTRPLVNTHDQLVAAGGGIAILYRARGSRPSSVPGWLVLRVDARGVEVATDSRAHFSSYGKKLFIAGASDTRQAALQKALDWVQQTYGEAGPWVMNAVRDYVPERIQKQFPIPKRKK